MSSELVVRSQLEKSTSGKVFIPDYKLMELSYQELDAIQGAFMQLVVDNPDYEFMQEERLFERGITIRWRKIA